MAARSLSSPPRPVVVGDVVAAYSDPLGAWTAGQITGIDGDWKKVDVLDLDWSGPEPTSLLDLGDLRPLRLTHHSWEGKLSHCHFNWVLPRSHKVIGNRPLLRTEGSNSYGSEWRLGLQLALQRSWDGGNHDSWVDPGARTFSDEYFLHEVDGRPALDGEVYDVTITVADTFDCSGLVAAYPGLKRLTLRGKLGTLTNAESLNRLTELQRLSISDLFGMTSMDRLTPEHVPHLETLSLSSVPAEYATAMRATWRTEIPNGTDVDIHSPRKPDWVAENRDNPLRDWDGREHISTARFKKAVAQYKATRRAVLAELRAPETADQLSRLFSLGREYGEAFNHMDRRNSFIETGEREELFDALAGIVKTAEEGLGRDLAWAGEHLINGLESIRDW
ncbi:hypothetical protein [Amycolatopsis sp. NPDC052450]|uniref:hypothetical protein n=1 Tax=Amycolatopsis sp. NPDC052450 TaxID=3363937 RepID=UPI0037C7E2C3